MQQYGFSAGAFLTSSAVQHPHFQASTNLCLWRSLTVRHRHENLQLCGVAIPLGTAFQAECQSMDSSAPVLYTHASD